MGVDGGAVLLDVDGVPVFIKRIPLTDWQLARPSCTANLFGPPLFCQHGIGSRDSTPGMNRPRTWSSPIRL